MVYVNSADPGQTAVWSGSTLFAIPLSILKYSNCIKSKILAKKYGIKYSKF